MDLFSEIGFALWDYLSFLIIQVPNVHLFKKYHIKTNTKIS